MGLEVTMLMRRSTMALHSSVQMNSALAFNSAVTGRAIFVKLGMKGHWYPRTPSSERNSFRFLGVRGQSQIAETFPGLMVTPVWVSWRPRKLISEMRKVHFESFRNRLLSLRMLKKARVISVCKLSSLGPVVMRQSSM